ncbi:MAG: PaaI family thioesterase [Peptococcaceae bacterium]|nr:PaaI family thioesterase [Peptococcaceae bacterium]
MRHKVTGRQYITEKCFGCGRDNPAGLKADFYNLENGEIVAVFQAPEHFQGYPQRLHGGVTATIMDEALGRAILAGEPDCWAVTAELTLRYKKPVPLGEPLRVVARLTGNNRRLFKSAGELLLPDGEVAVTAVGTYVKQPLGKITDLANADVGEERIFQDNDREFIEF